MQKKQYRVYQNPDGPEIGACSAGILEVDGLYFKDLAGTGELLPYEDWRLSDDERAKDLAKRLSVEEIAKLLHKKASTVRTQLTRARKKLSQLCLYRETQSN